MDTDLSLHGHVAQNFLKASRPPEPQLLTKPEVINSTFEQLMVFSTYGRPDSETRNIAQVKFLMTSYDSFIEYC